METVSILFNQIIIMFIFCGIGAVLYQCGKITKEGSKTLGNILLYLVLPCVIINGFCVERTKETIMLLGVSALAAAVTLLLSMLISYFFFRKDPIANFAAAFSNPGFFGIPLIIASLGSDAVFFVTAFIGFLNLLQWSYGVSVMTGQKTGIQPKAVLKAPFMIAILIGLALFLSGITLPSIFTNTISYVTGINTPLAMITIGVYLAQTDIFKMFTHIRLYLVSLVRMVIIPLVCMIVLYPIPNSYLNLKLAILICTACPVGSNVAVYAQLHDKDYTYAVETVVISTIFSPVTIPAIIYLATLLY